MTTTFLQQFETGDVPAIDHNKFVAIVDAGAVEDVIAYGAGGAWSLAVVCNHQVHALTAARSKGLRRFARVDSVLAYLKDVGVVGFRVDVAGAAEAANGNRKRPDLAEAMRETHASAADHRRWLEEAAEAEDGLPTVPGQLVEARMAARRKGG
ncbi:MAG TPA: hypothetical protein VGO76_17605 [Luteibacter sp.]|jgi:hypothetical protein|nr:hypothetical protein [Luteibacter sp.]